MWIGNVIYPIAVKFCGQVQGSHALFLPPEEKEEVEEEEEAAVSPTYTRNKGQQYKTFLQYCKTAGMRFCSPACYPVTWAGWRDRHSESPWLCPMHSDGTVADAPPRHPHPPDHLRRRDL